MPGLQDPQPPYRVLREELDRIKYDIGQVSIKDRPMCQVLRTSAQTLILNNSTTTITWQTALVNDDEMWRPGVPTVIRPAKTGWYDCTFGAYWGTVGAASARQMAIRRTITGYTVAFFENPSVTHGSNVISGPVFIDANANDTVFAQVFQNSGATLEVGTSSNGVAPFPLFLSVIWLRGA